MSIQTYTTKQRALVQVWLEKLKDEYQLDYLYIHQPGPSISSPVDRGYFALGKDGEAYEVYPGDFSGMEILTSWLKSHIGKQNGK